MDYELIKWLVPTLISILALISSRKAQAIAKKSLEIAERAERKANIEYLDTIPSLEIVDLININGDYRVKLLLSNLRSNPFKIHGLKVFQEVSRKLSLSDVLWKMLDSKYDWHYERVYGTAWNPKGDLDDTIKFVREAAQFQTVKDAEYLLVSIPNFSPNRKYKFVVNTSHGVKAIEGRISENSDTYFCEDFSQYYS